MVKFLIVEDNADDAQLAERLLRKTFSDVRIHMASTLAGGLLLASVERPDCVLLDFNLPDATGNEIVQSIKTFERAGCAVMIMTGGDTSKIAALAGETILGKDSLSASVPDFNKEIDRCLGNIEQHHNAVIQNIAAMREFLKSQREKPTDGAAP